MAEMEEANAKLTQSLERCRALLSECRSTLSANSNDAGAAQEDGQTQLG
jgi:hypothetical protein